MNTSFRTLLQVLLLIAVWSGANYAATWLRLPVSGGVLGLLLMVALLMSGALRPAAIERGADWLLSHMLLFFIPLIVSVVQFTGLLQREGVRLFLAIGIGFICVLMAVAFTVEWACRIGRGRRLRELRALRAGAAA